MRKLLLTILIILTLCNPASAEFFSDVIITSPDGIWTDERAYATLEDAITAVGSNNRTIVVASEEVVTDLDIPSNVTLRFERGGSINNSGHLDIHTPNIIASNYQIFTGTGEIDFAVGTNLRSTWFADLHTMFDQTVDNYVTCIITSGWSADIDADCSVGNNVTLKWEGAGNRIVINSGFELSNINNIDAGKFQIFGGSGDLDFVDGAVLKISWFNRLRTINNWIESESVKLLIDYSISTDYTQSIASNISISFINGTDLTIDVGATVTFEGFIDAEPYRIFLGDGDAILNGNSTVYCEWWGGSADGATDSFDSVVSAVTALSGTTEKGTIELLSGEYIWGGDRVIMPNIYLKGQGWNYTKVTLQNDGELTSIPVTSKISSGSNNLTIDGIHFESGAWETSSRVRILWTINDSYITVKNCKFSCSDHPIHISGDCTNINILNNILVNSSLTVNGGSPAISVQGNSGNFPNNVIIDGNYCETGTCTFLNGNAMCSINVQIVNGNISNNILGGSYAAAILLETNSSEYVNIYGNVIDTTGHVESNLSGIFIQKASNVNVYGNIITVTGEDYSNAINIQPDEVLTNYVNIISNNMINYCGRGIRVQSNNTTHNGTLKIDGNIILNAQYRALEIISSSGTTSEDAIVDISNNVSIGTVGTGNLRDFYIAMREEAGFLNLVNNFSHPDAAYGRDEVFQFGTTPPSYIADNKLNKTNASKIYQFYQFGNAMASADVANVKFGDSVKWVTLNPIDLSGGASTYTVTNAGNTEKCLWKITLLYTEASSADAGVDIVVRYSGSSGVKNIHTYTSETNEAIWYSKELYLPDFDSFSNAYTVDTGYEWLQVYCAGGKTGTGEVSVALEWVENE